MLDKRSRNILIIMGTAIFIIVLAEVFRPRPLDWRPSYTSADKIPFGAFVMFEEIKDLFNGATVERVSRDPYEFLLDSTYSPNSAYVFIDDNLFFDQRQVDELTKYASEGNTVFISSRNYGYIVGDSLNITTEIDYDVLNDTLQPKFFNTAFESNSEFSKGTFRSTFEKVDTLNTVALGYLISEAPEIESLNYISVKKGKGQFLFHTLPEAFTNYYLLNGNEQYAAQVLSYIDSNEIYWDSYLKSGRKVVTSPMRFVLTQPALKWAYYLGMLGVIVLLIFKAKREQRIIEVIKPLENTSIEFTRTIGDLYFQHKDYTDIIAKKITYFLEVVRSKYYLSTQLLDDTFILKLSQKSGNPKDKTQKLIEYINHLKGKAVHSEQDLIELNKKTQDFNL
ncbi:MAG: DUF4350 domain-containing protein [Flavobacteriaceae bacterium]|nr:DUF4350 domain-containing protein [Flavobacteriaceae bacterium]